MRKFLALASLVAFLLSLQSAPWAQQKQAASTAPAVEDPDHPTTVLIIRHAERQKIKEGKVDVPLIGAGKKRAKTLVHVAGKAKIAAIYSSQFKRTQQTAQELADYLKLDINQVEVTLEPPYNVPELVYEIKEYNEGETVLVVSHGPIIPEIIRELGGGEIAEIGNEFDNFFVLVIPRDGPVKLVHLKYGAPTPKKEDFH